MALLVRLSKSRPLGVIPKILSRAAPRLWWKQQPRCQVLRCMSSIQQEDHKPQLRTLTDVMTLIDKKRADMNESNPFFAALRDSSLSKEQRLSFVPYMLFFSMGFADVLTLGMRVDKPNHELNDIERSVNGYINEDNFHYNYYLRDLQTLGFTLDKFGSTEALVRCIWATEGIPTRRLIYTLLTTIGRSKDPIVSLCVFEMLEAGLHGLFTTIYKEIATAKDGMPELEYFGDTHVGLEMNHTVTHWFSDKDHPSEPEKVLSPEVAEVLYDVTEELMGRFDAMYLSWYEIIKQGGAFISPKKYDIKGTPPIDKITENWKEVSSPEDL